MDDAATHHPRIFSRNVVLLGAVIGLVFMATMFLASTWSDVDDIVVARALLLPGVEATADACVAPMREEMLDARGKVTLSYGNEPDYVLVVPTAALSDAVLAIGSIVDAAIPYRCEGASLVNLGMAAGDILPFADRVIQRPEIAFPVGPVGPSDRFILAINQNALISTDIHLQDRSTFEQASEQRLMIRLFLIGAISVLATYNAVLAFVARNITFLFNALTIASMLMLDLYLSGLGAAYLWPSRPWLSNALLGLALAGPSLFAPFYVFHFLDDRPYRAFFQSKRYWFWPAASIAGLALMPFLPLWMVYIFHTGLWIVMTLVFVALLLRQTLSGDERASILMVPILGAIVPAMIIGAMKEFAGYDFGLIAQHGTEAALVVEALLFTLALAYLLRLSRRREKDALHTANRLSRSVNERLVQTLDDERARVASELHDTAGQGVVLIVNRLKRLAARPRLSRALRQDVAGIEALAGEMLDEIRGMSHNLHPAVLDHLGFERAATALAENLSKANAQEITVDFPDARIALTRNQALQLYRIVQELLTNALKHARARLIRLSLHIRDGEAELVVSDDGRGFPDTASEPADSGMGMRILAQRVASLPAQLAIATGKEGTDIRIRFTPGGAPQGGRS